ncbi:uncharacterized protein LOC119572988 isoform X3 [Penaeus monodon]|uniref:uncharacterized protein LOC119572988 isoform X3 n=1 Tax=Penaeus monodon TaxID=6687 RepID=UPI0018A719E8|nr:uncharacterized protein LOC119572988 isoform X3 [Penaeus monodon]
MSIHSHFVMHHTWTSLPSFGSPFRRTSFFNSLTYSTTSSLFSHLPFCHFPHIETFRYIHPFSGDCRMACWSDRRCVAASALAAKDKSVLCRLSSKGPFDSTLDDSPNATYIFWNEHAIIMDDGLVYTEATRIGSFVEMENLCNGVPGHRLPIFKTFVQKNVMDQLFNRDNRAVWERILISPSPSTEVKREACGEEVTLGQRMELG